MRETVHIANKDNAELRIGYLKSYGGQEFRLAVAEFSEKYPDVSVQIINGNHEDLYDALRNGGVDLILSDQRRAFSDENERIYYQEVIGIKGDFLFAENLEKARLLVIGGKGFTPIEGGEHEPGFAATLRRILLTRRGKPISRNYCAFWKTDNSGYYVEDFADILKSKFPSESRM